MGFEEKIEKFLAQESGDEGFAVNAAWASHARVVSRVFGDLKSLITVKERVRGNLISSD